jgi:hypothetical protein
MSVRRKFSDLLKYFNPFAAIPSPPDEDEETPAAKRPRLHTSTSIPTVAEDAADEDIFLDAQTYWYMADDKLNASPDDTIKVLLAPTYAVTVAATSLPSTGASRARRRKWAPEEDAKLTEAVTELGTGNWIQVAALVPGRTNDQ